MVYTADRIQQILIDLKDNKITIEDAQRQLEFDAWCEEKDLRRETNKRREKIIENQTEKYIQTYGKQPEEIVLEKERLKEIVLLLTKIKSILNKKQFEILWLYCVEKWTQERIAGKYGVDRTAITHYLQRIYEKINKNVTFSSVYPTIGRWIFLPNESTLEADTPKHKIAYPSEYFKKISVGCIKRNNKNGKKYFIRKNKCIVDTYLDESFNDKQTICNMCDKCSNRVMLKRQKKVKILNDKTRDSTF